MIITSTAKEIAHCAGPFHVLVICGCSTGATAAGPPSSDPVLCSYLHDIWAMVGYRSKFMLRLFLKTVSATHSSAHQLMILSCIVYLNARSDLSP